ncbi:uncharacterized protein LOC142348756 [Convolutriloba macropyga]|uniref:uncharacterized protein LOC142348756 n=1 Tax=Convolutriloba macropyga TaxID=536237 RepID=UPI003F522237
MIPVVPSHEYLEVHCCMFLGFSLSAFIHQGCRLREFKLCGKHSPEIAKTYKKLKKIFIGGSLLLITALIFSFLHFVSCVSGAYSLFAAFEYLYVMYGNIYFHYKVLSAVGELNSSQLFTISNKLVINRKQSLKSNHMKTNSSSFTSLTSDAVTSSSSQSNSMAARNQVM